MSTTDRWSFKVDVTDAHGRPRKLGIGAEDGHVIFGLLDDAGHVLGFSRAEPDAADQLAPVVQVAADRARTQRRPQ